MHLVRPSTSAAARTRNGAATVVAAASFAAALLLLSAPALWNGYPLLQYDTGGYLARWYEKYLVLARSTVFGLYLHVGEGLHFWPNIAMQSALTIWIVALLLRALRLAGGQALVLAIVFVLSVATTLPWLTSILLTDIFAGVGVLALYLVLFRAAELTLFERVALTLVIAFAAAVHSATLATLLAIILAAALAKACVARLVSWGRLAHGIAAIALGAMMLLAANAALSGRLAWTPGGYGLAFGRMLQDGIVARYLDDRCPTTPLRLCPYRHRLPPTADEFFWGDSVFNELGRFDGLGDEMRSIVLGSLVAYPAMQVRTALLTTLRQLAMVATGAGVNDQPHHTYGIIERFIPGEVPAMRAARQQHGELDFSAINRLHVPVAYAASILVLLLLLRLRREPLDDLALLAAVVTVATLANAVVLSVISGPHDRYGARIAWLPVLVAILYALQRVRRRGASG